MAKTYLDGLQYGIDTFEPGLQHRVSLLQELFLEKNKDWGTIENTRGAVRAYAEIIGLLKVQRDQAAGKDATPRAMLQAEYMRELEKFDRIVDRGKAATTEEERLSLGKEMQAQDHRIDAAFVKFALSDSRGPANQSRPSGLVH